MLFFVKCSIFSNDNKSTMKTTTSDPESKYDHCALSQILPSSPKQGEFSQNPQNGAE